MRGNEGGSFTALDCAGLKVGKRQTRSVTAGSHDWGATTPWLEVGEGLTAWPYLPVTGRKRKGGKVRLGQWGSVVGSACCAREREADGPSWLAGCGKREGESWASWSGPQGKRGEGRERF
jgi:hypothetical protein